MCGSSHGERRTLLASKSAIQGGSSPFQDSSVSVVASMLLSPLMGPILAITFGVAVKDRQLCNVGWHAELWGIVVAFLTGVLVATVMAPLYPMEAWDASADEEAHFTGSDLAIGN